MNSLLLADIEFSKASPPPTANYPHPTVILPGNTACLWIERWVDNAQLKSDLYVVHRVGLVRSGPVRSQKDRSFSQDRTGPRPDRFTFRKLVYNQSLLRMVITERKMIKNN